MLPTSINGFIDPERGSVVLPEQNVPNNPHRYEFRGASHER
jgi:hypothetical protein